MKGFKRILAFILMFAMVVGGIEPFTLTAYAEGSEASYCSISFANVVFDENEFMFHMSGSDNALNPEEVGAKWNITQGGYPVETIVELVERPDGDEPGEDEPMESDFEDAEAYEAAYSEWLALYEIWAPYYEYSGQISDLADDNEAFFLSDGTAITLEVPVSELGDVGIQVVPNDIRKYPQPILFDFRCDSNAYTPQYSPGIMWHAGGPEQDFNALAPVTLDKLITEDAPKTASISYQSRWKASDWSYLQFLPTENDTKAEWETDYDENNAVNNSTQTYIVYTSGEKQYMFQFGQIQSRNGEEIFVPSADLRPNEGNAFVKTNYIKNENYTENGPEPEYIIDPNHPEGDPVVRTSSDVSFALRYCPESNGLSADRIRLFVDGENEEIEADENGVFRFNAPNTYTATIGDLSQPVQAIGIGCNVDGREISGLSFEGTDHVTGFYIDDCKMSVDSYVETAMVGKTRKFGYEADNQYVEIDDYSYDDFAVETEPGYVLTGLTIRNPNQPAVSFEICQFDDNRGVFPIENGVFTDTDDNVIERIWEYVSDHKEGCTNENGEYYVTVNKAFVIEDGATVTFQTKKIVIRIDSDGPINDESDDIQIHNVYASDVADALQITKKYFMSLDDEELKLLNHIDWAVMDENINLDDSILKFVHDSNDPVGFEDQDILRLIRINLYKGNDLTGNDVYGTLTVPAGKTLSFPGEIQGQYADPDTDGVVSAGSKIILGSNAKLNVYTAVDDSYMLLDDEDNLYLEQHGRVRVFEISGSGASVTVSGFDDGSDRFDAQLCVGKVNVKDVTVDTGGQFESISDQYRFLVPSITITNLTIEKAGNFDIRDSRAGIDKVTVKEEANARIGALEPMYAELGEYPVTINTLTLGYRAHADLSGKMHVENMSVGEEAGVTSYGDTEVGTITSSSSNSYTTSGSFVLSTGANIRNYGALKIYPTATISGGSEIRTAGYVNLFKVNLVNAPDRQFSEVNLISQSGELSSEGLSPGWYYLGGPVTGALATSNNGEWSGVRFALYNADDIDYVWPDECYYGNVKIIDDEFVYIGSGQNEGWHYEWRRLDTPKYEGKGTLRAFPLGEHAFIAPAANGENHDLYVLVKAAGDGYREEQNYHFVAEMVPETTKVSSYYLDPDSVTFYVADPDNEGKYPEWGDESITAFDDEFLDIQEVLDFINDPANATDIYEKKIFIKVNGNVRIDNLLLPLDNEVEFVGTSGNNRMEVTVSADASIEHDLIMNNVDLGICYEVPDSGNMWPIPSLTFRDIYLTDSVLKLTPKEGLDDCPGGTRTITAGNIYFTTVDPEVNSGIEISGDNTLHVTSVTVNEGAGAWINDNSDNMDGTELELGTVTVDENAVFSIDTAYAGEFSTIDVSADIIAEDGSDIQINANRFDAKTKIELGKVRHAGFSTYTLTAGSISVADDANDVHFNGWGEGITVNGGISVGKNINNISFEGEGISASGIEIDEDSHPFFRAGLTDVTAGILTLRERSSIGTWDGGHEWPTVSAFVLDSLCMYDGSNLDADGLVAKEVTFTGSPHMNLFGNGNKIIGDSDPFSGEGSLSLVYDETIGGGWQGPTFNRVTCDSQFAICVENLNRDSKTGINFEHRAMTDDAQCEFFSSKDLIAEFVVGEDTPVNDIRDDIFVHAESGEQQTDLYKSKTQNGYDYYELKTVGVQIFSAPILSGDYKKVATTADYKEAVAYIDRIGNTGQKFRVELSADNVELDGPLVLPKAASAGEFTIEGIVTRYRYEPDDPDGWTQDDWDAFNADPEAYSGEKHEVPDDVTKLNFTGDVKLLCNTTFKNVKLVSCAPDDMDPAKKTKYTATFNTSGKDVVFERAEINVDRRLEHVDWVGFGSITGNSNITLKDLNGCACLKTTGAITAKSITLDNSAMESYGKITVAGDLDVRNGSGVNCYDSINVNGNLYAERSGLYRMKANSTIKGNAYLERANVEMAAGTFTVSKDLYSLRSSIQLANDYDSIADDLERDPMYRVMIHDGDTNVTVSGKSFLTDTQILATRNVTLGTVYSDHGVEVFYGKDAQKDKFTVKSLVETDNRAVIWNNSDDDYEWSWPFWWAFEGMYSTELGWDPSEHYFVIGDNCTATDFSVDVDGKHNNVYDYQASSDGAIRVRRASVEKDYYDDILGVTEAPEGFAILNDSDYVPSVKFAAKLAKLYMDDAGKTILVNTTEDPIKFIAGGFWTNGDSPAAMYTLKSVKGGLAIANGTGGYKIVLRVLPGLKDYDSYDSVKIGYYDTLDEAFAKIKALKNKNVGYAIDIYTDDGVGTSKDKNFAIPADAYKILFNNTNPEENGKANLYFKDALSLSTDVYFSDITLESKTFDKPTVNLSLGNYGLEFDDCTLLFQGGIKNVKGSGVKGNSYVGFRFSKESYDKFKNTGFINVDADTIDGVGCLAVCNANLNVTGKINVGDLDATAYNWYDSQEALAFYDAAENYLGDDPRMTQNHWVDGIGYVYDAYQTGEDPETHEPIYTPISYEKSIIEQRFGQNYCNSYTRIKVPVTAALKNGKFTVIPNITVNKDIIACGGEFFKAVNEGASDETGIVAVDVTNQFAICPYVKSGTDEVALLEYLRGLCGDDAELQAKLVEYKHEGIPFVIAPKASADIAKYDTASNGGVPTPAEGGMYVKSVVGSSVFICYSDLEYAPYTVFRTENVVKTDNAGNETVDTEEFKIADTMSWSTAVNTINKAATKQDYIIQLNHDPDADTDGASGESLAPNTAQTPDVITMPTASAVQSLVIRSEAHENSYAAPFWYYLGDKITLTSDTTFENITLAGVVYDRDAGEYVYIDQIEGCANGGALTILTPYTLVVSGNVFLNYRHLILDGNGKKGSLVLKDDDSMLSWYGRAEDEPGGIDIYGEIKNFKTIELCGTDANIEAYFTTAKNANHLNRDGDDDPVYTAAAISVTDLAITEEGQEVCVDGTITITNASMLGDTKLNAEISNGYVETPRKISITNLNSAGGYVVSDYGMIDITSITVSSATDNDGGEIVGGIYAGTSITLSKVDVNAPDSTFDVDAGQITVKTSLNVSAGKISFAYDPTGFSVNGTVNVADDSMIIVCPYDLAEALCEGSEETFEFVKTAKGNAEQFTPAKYDNISYNYIPCAYDGNNPNTVFLYKQKNVIYGANAGNAVKATVRKGSIDAPAAYFFTYADAIASMNDKDAAYFLEVNDNTAPETAPIVLSAPAAAKADSFTICGSGATELYYTSISSFTTSVNFMGVELKPVKKSGAEYVQAAYPITLSGDKILALNDVKGLENVSGITATAGLVTIIGNNDYVPLVTDIGGNINVKNLVLSNSGVTSLGTVTVSDELMLSNAVLNGGDNKAVKLNDIAVHDQPVAGEDAVNKSSVGFSRLYTEKNGTKTDKGTSLTITGKVTGQPQFNMLIAPGLPGYADYALTAEDLGKGSLPVSKLLFTAAGLETRYMDTETFSLDLPFGTKLVKANGGFYLVDSGLDGVAITLKEIGENASVIFQTDYLDVNQSLKRISEIGNLNGDYQLLFPDITVTDTDVIDKVVCSGLALPGDNKASTVIFNAGDSGSLKYSGNITAYGRLQMDMLLLYPCDVKGNPSETSTVTIKQNSKNNVIFGSGLYLNEGFELDGVFKSVTGVAGKSFLSYYDKNEPLIITGKLSQFAEVTSEGPIITGNTASIGTLGLDEEAKFAATTASNVDNIVVGEDGGILWAAYTTDKNGDFANTTFTINGTVEGEETLLVELFPTINPDTKKAWVLTYEDTETTLLKLLNSGVVIDGDAARGKALVIAKKADASMFRPEQMTETYIDENNIILYKNAAGAVIADSKDDMAVEITKTVMDEYHEEVVFDTYARTWADAVITVDGIADKDAEYNFIILKEKIYADKANGGSNGTTPGALVMPKATSASMITVMTSDAEEVGLSGKMSEIAYKGALNPTCNVVFDNVKLQEYGTNGPVADYAAKIGVSGAVTLGFTDKTRNNDETALKFNAVSVPKGTLRLVENVDLETDGAVNVANLQLERKAESDPVPDPAPAPKPISIIPIASASNTYAKQTYGSITGCGTLELSNYFTKAVPTSAVSQLSVTGTVSPDAEIRVSLYNAKYDRIKAKGKTTFKLATPDPGDEAYEAMGEDYMYEFLELTDASKTPSDKTALLAAPYVSMSQISFYSGEYTEEEDALSEDVLAKISGKYFYKAEGLNPVVKLSVNTDYDPDYEQEELFLSWDAAVTELNKVADFCYEYRLDLLEDIGGVQIDDVILKSGKNEEGFTVVKSVALSKLNLPANVNRLTICGNGHSITFTTPSVTVSSNIVFDDVSFNCLKKVTNKEIRDGVNNSGAPAKVTYSVPTYVATPISINVAKYCELIINEYRNDNYVYGDGRECKVGRTNISAITGANTSDLQIGCTWGFPEIGKISNFHDVEITENSYFDDSYDQYGEYTVTGDIAVTNLYVKGVDVEAANVTVTDTLTLESGCVKAVGTGNMKLNNIKVIDNNSTLIAKQNAKGASLLSISGDIMADSGNRLGIGILYPAATADRPGYLVLSGGETIASVSKPDNVKFLTLLRDGIDSEEGHQIGDEAEFEDGFCQQAGWYLDYDANTKSVIFKTAVEGN